MTRTGRTLTLTLAIVGTGAVSADAATLSVSPVKPCYLTGDTVTLSGSGFTPSGSVLISNDQAPAGALPADQSGNVSGTLTFGSMPGVRSRNVVATDSANPALSALAPFIGTQLDVKVRPSNARAGARRKVSATGFPSGVRLYAHVRRSGYRKRLALGMTQGPCGTLQTRARFMPANARTGRYTIQFDTSRRYSARTAPRVRFTLTVRRTS